MSGGLSLLASALEKGINVPFSQRLVGIAEGNSRPCHLVQHWKKYFLTLYSGIVFFENYFTCKSNLENQSWVTVVEGRVRGGLRLPQDSQRTPRRPLIQ